MKRRILLVLSCALVLFLVAAGVLVWSGTTDHLGEADVALVLGNQVNPDGSPSPRLKARLNTAAELFHQGYFPKIIVSGGTGKEGVPEGTAMKRYLVSAGVPDLAILVDDQGVDTSASAKNAVAILEREDLTSVFVISQYFHIPRCRLALSSLGVSPIFNAHPRYFEIRDFYSIVRELPAYFMYFVRSTRGKEVVPASA